MLPQHWALYAKLDSTSTFMRLIIYCTGYEIKWSYDPCSHQRNFSHCIEKLEIFHIRSSIYDSCHIIHLINDWSRGEQWILFPSNLNVSLDFVSGNIEICYITKNLDKNKSKFWKTRGYSGDNIRPLSTARSDHVQQRSTFRG